MNNEKCPCCHNHCDKDNLSCSRGIEYFNKEDNSEQLTINEKVINNLRKCGHFLHHAEKMANDSLLAGLSENELNELNLLLAKICNNI